VGKRRVPKKVGEKDLKRGEKGHREQFKPNNTEGAGNQRGKNPGEKTTLSQKCFKERGRGEKRAKKEAEREKPTPGPETAVEKKNKGWKNKHDERYKDELW